MVGSRTVTALVGLAVSLAVSVAAWVYLDTLLLFLVVPFVPLLLRGGADRGRRRSRGADGRPPVRRCPSCGFETRDPEFEYCPRDGRRLDRQSGSS